MSTDVVELSFESKKEIDYWLKKFPDNQRQSALLAALHIVQDENKGSLTPALMDMIAKYIGVAPIVVYEVASFYMMYDLKPVGRYKIYLCTNISCMLRGAYEIMDHIKQKLGVKPDETTKDGKFTLKEFECLGACVGAPMMQVNKDYYENLTCERVDEILDHLK